MKKPKQTRKTALMKWLLRGNSVSIKNAYLYFGISNISREVRRLIEKPLGIELKRTQQTGKTMYGTNCYWLKYTATPQNKKVLKKYLSDRNIY